VTASNGTAETRFDIRDLQGRAWSEGWYWLTYYGAFAILTALTLVLAAIYLAKFRSQGLSVDSLTSLVPGAAIEAFVVWMMRLSARGAEEIVASDRLIQLVYPSGKRRTYDFADARCRLVIRGRGDQRLGARQWRISGGVPFQSFIPGEVRAYLLALAQTQGWSIAERVS
jgi:hypothetical protein